MAQHKHYNSVNSGAARSSNRKAIISQSTKICSFSNIRRNIMGNIYFYSAAAVLLLVIGLLLMVICVRHFRHSANENDSKEVFVPWSQRCEGRNKCVECSSSMPDMLKPVHPKCCREHRAETSTEAILQKLNKTNSMNTITFQNDATLKELEKAAEKGNPMAKILLDTNFHYGNAILILFSKFCTQKPYFSRMVGEMASAIRLEQSFIFTTKQLAVKFLDTFDSHITSGGSEKSDLDRDIRVCYCFYRLASLTANSNQLISYAKLSSDKYPREAYFNIVLGTLRILKKDYATGLKEINKALKINPVHHELLYTKLMLRSHLKVDQENINKDHLEYIKYAPVGSRSIPASYYSIVFNHAMLCAKNGKIDDQNLKNMAKYIKLGKQSETDLAPCYKPYNDTADIKKKSEEMLRLLTLKKLSQK